MIHDEGIKKAIDWLYNFGNMPKGMQPAIISGLRELQNSRKKLAALKEAEKEIEDYGKPYIGSEPLVRPSQMLDILDKHGLVDK